MDDQILLDFGHLTVGLFVDLGQAVLDPLVQQIAVLHLIRHVRLGHVLHVVIHGEVGDVIVGILVQLGLEGAVGVLRRILGGPEVARHAEVMGIIPGEGQHLSPVDLHDTVGHVDAVFLRVVNGIGETVVIIGGSGVAIGHAVCRYLIILDLGRHGGSLLGGLHLFFSGIAGIRGSLS